MASSSSSPAAQQMPAPEDTRLPSPTPSELDLAPLQISTSQRDLEINQASIDPAHSIVPSPTSIPSPTQYARTDNPSRSLPRVPSIRDTPPRSPSPPSIRIGHRTNPPPPPRPRPRPPISARLRSALGITTPKTSLIWRLAFGTSEIVVISVLLGLASVPGSASAGFGERWGLNQWEACERPLGGWDIVWAVKAFLSLGMAGWEYWRAVRPNMDELIAVERARLAREVRRARAENTRARLSSRNTGAGTNERRAQTHPDPNTNSNSNSNGDMVQPPPRALVRSSSAPTPGRAAAARDVWLMGGGREEDLDLMDARMSGSARSLEIVEKMRKMRARREREERWYSRCTSLQALYSLVWFVTANILLYGSMETCRYTSPYIWWLTFGLLCLGYIVVAEMVLVALVVFIIGPLLYLIINIILVCLGRHPIQPGGRMGHINPDVPKMPRTMVDRIPLVMYIPTPDPDPNPATSPDQPATSTPSESDSKPAGHVYPPETKDRKRRRFFFFRKKTKPVANKPEPGTGVEDDLEAGWEKNEYPFVKLESNRAACAICLMDFEPPRRVGEEEGGENGAEPLRLLACGHVFHKDCLDPWLVDVSGRCPTCQRPVEEDDLNPEEGGKKNKRRGWRRNQA